MTEKDFSFLLCFQPFPSTGPKPSIFHLNIRPTVLHRSGGWSAHHYKNISRGYLMIVLPQKVILSPEKQLLWLICQLTWIWDHRSKAFTSSLPYLELFPSLHLYISDGEDRHSFNLEVKIGHNLFFCSKEDSLTTCISLVLWKADFVMFWVCSAQALC